MWGGLSDVCATLRSVGGVRHKYGPPTHGDHLSRICEIDMYERRTFARIDADAGGPGGAPLA